MKSKKSNGKGKPAAKRGVKDLPPGKTQNVKGGWYLSMAMTEADPKPKAKSSFSDFNFPHSQDKSSPILM